MEGGDGGGIKYIYFREQNVNRSYLSLPVKAGVPREQTHPVPAELPTEVGKLLIREGLERRRVEHPEAQGESIVDGELSHDSLAAARGRRNDDAVPLGEAPEGLSLKGVELEGKQGLEKFGLHLGDGAGEGGENAKKKKQKKKRRRKKLGRGKKWVGQCYSFPRTCRLLSDSGNEP